MIFTKEEQQRFKKIPSNYVGGKKRLLPHLESILEQINFETVYDGFCGSGATSYLFDKMNKFVWASDIMNFPVNSTKTMLSLGPSDFEKVNTDELINESNAFANLPFFNKYLDKVFTQNELNKIQNIWMNIQNIFEEREQIAASEIFYKSILNSVPNSNFTVYGKSLNNIRSTHDQNKSFWDEKWRDTTRKRRDENNEIKFQEVLGEFKEKFVSGFKINNIGERSAKNDVFKKSFFENGESSDYRHADLVYLDPPYGKSSNNFYKLYNFFEDLHYQNDSSLYYKEEMTLFTHKAKYSGTISQMIDMCSNHKFILLSHNDNSFLNLDQIITIIKKHGLIILEAREIPLTYKFRTNKTNSRKGTEYLILCQNKKK